MNILILGAAGFIGTNLALSLVKNKENKITLVDEKREYFSNNSLINMDNVSVSIEKFDKNADFENILENQGIVYHLVSTTIPTTSNRQIQHEMEENIGFTVNLLEQCVKCGVKKIVFISSGGTVYGREGVCPLKEDTPTHPITSYGVQKLAIEKMLYLYNYMYGLDYNIIRLANPYGPYQRPNGMLGAVTTFTYKALKKEEILVYGDGSVVRDYIYIDDAIKAIKTIAEGESEQKLFNVGCGYGTSINKLLEEIKLALGIEMNIVYKDGRQVDVPVNYLDINRYEKIYGKLNPISLQDGIKKTAGFMIKEYGV